MVTSRLGVQQIHRNYRCFDRSAIVALLVVCFVYSAKGQSQAADSLAENISSRTSGGLDIGYGWGSGGSHGPGLELSYRTALGSIDLQGVLFQRWFNNDVYSLGHFGFGFGFLVFKPSLFVLSDGGTVLEPLIGLDFTVWTSTLGIGFPLGAEIRMPVVRHIQVSCALTYEPQINLNTIQNTRIFDVRLGVRYQ